MYHFFHYHRSQPRLDGIGNDEVDRPPEYFFQKILQIHVGVKGFSVEFHDEIKIAVGPRLISRGRTKQAQSPNPIPPNGRRVPMDRLQNLVPPISHGRSLPLLGGLGKYLWVGVGRGQTLNCCLGSIGQMCERFWSKSSFKKLEWK